METQFLKDRIESAIQQVKSFNEREELFNQNLSEYVDLDTVNEEFEPFFKMWEIAADFDQQRSDWMTGNFLELNAQNIEKQTKLYIRGINTLITQFQKSR